MVKQPGPAKGRQARHSERREQRKQIIAKTVSNNLKLIMIN